MSGRIGILGLKYNKQILLLCEIILKLLLFDNNYILREVI